MKKEDTQTEVSARPLVGILGRYVLRQELASGGMATVYLAHLSGPHGFEKAVALKQIHPHLAKDRRFVEMFLDEARVVGMIHHPNVCTLVDFGEDNGVPYLVLEYLNGEPMSAVVDAARASGDAPTWLFARIVHDAARGLHAAHQLAGPDGRPLGVVHRDVSPHNIFVLYDGLTKVVDFGVARARGRLSVTQSNEVKGKLPYMSPEQFENAAVDHGTDLWALGVVLWESTVGRRLFRAESDAATIAAVLHKPVPPPSDFVPDYPPALEAIVMRCLERDPARRFETAEQLADALEDYLYAIGKPVGASQVKRWMHVHFAAEIAHRAAVLRGEAPPPPPARDGGASVAADRDDAVAAASDAVASVPDTSAHDDAPTAFVRRPRSPDASSETPLESTAVEPAALAADVAAQAASRYADATGRTPTERPQPSPAEAAPASPRRFTWVAVLALMTILAIGLTAARGHRGTPGAADATTNTTRASTAPARTTPAEPEGSGVVAAPALAAPTPAIVHDEPATAPEVDAGLAASTPEVPRTRPTPARATAPVARGRLNLMAVPSARVRIDGRSVGETPLLDHSIAAGDHRVELVTSDGRRRSFVVHVEPGQQTRQSVRF